MMKFTAIFLLAVCLNAAAIGNAQRVSISEQNAPLEKIFKEIKKQTGYTFVYREALLSKAKKVTVNLSKATIEQVLNFCFQDQPFTYSIVNKIVVITDKRENAPEKVSVSIPPPPITIRGIITSDKGEPLAGATISEKGTNNSSSSQDDGSFTITVSKPDAVLVITYVGYDAREIKVNNHTSLAISLSPKSQDMNAVVVVGYGTQRKADVTGAVVSANLEAFKNAPNTNIIQSLQGTVPGLNIGQVTSAGSTPSISIRGANTISGNTSVLIVLDGIQYNGSLESINPDDIATIDVLKDASSTAVYGAQAANGVILITTRKGKKDQKPRINFSSSYATQTPTGNLRPLNREEYIDHVRDLYYEEAFLAPGFTQPNPNFNVATRVDASMKDANGNIVPVNFNWYDEATNTGYINDNQISVSGGGERFSYLFSGGLVNQSGFIVNDKFKRKSLRMNLESQVAPWLKVGIQSFGSFVNKDGSEPNISTIIQQSPLIEPYDSSGNLKPFPFNTNFSNPFLTYDVDDYERHNYLFANVYSELDVPFIEGLTYRINFGNNYRINQHNASSIYGAGFTGQAYKEFESYYDYTFDNILSYSRRFKDHNLSATLLYGAIERKNSFTEATANAFSRLTLGYNSLEQGANQFTYSDAWSEALNYQMARLNYKYNDRYLLTTTIRRDGFSGFAANNKYGYFPSVALGWVVTNEPFFKADWVNTLKIRAGYGVSGNQTRRYYSLAGLSGGAAYVFGEGGGTLFGQQVESLENPDLSWERTTGLNTGVDFSLFQGKLTGSVDYYNNLTRDLLFNVSLPAVTGFDEIRTNVGEIKNQGIELALTSRNINTKDFRWSTTLNFSRNTNKILKLVGMDADEDGKEDDLVESGLFIGRSINTYFDYQTNGIYQIGEIIPTGYSPGTYRVVDQDKNGVITTADRVVIGTRDPSFRASLLNALEYKGFTLTLFLNSIYGKKNNYLGSNSPSTIRDDNTVRYNYLSAIDYWSPINPDGKYSRSIVAGALTPQQYQNRSFIRLQDVNLSYRFTGGLIDKLNIQNLNVYVSGKNLATWTGWEGWDPETNQGLTINGRPVLKGYSVGFNLTF